MMTILAPLSRSIDPDGQPDAEACARCDYALTLASTYYGGQKNVIFALGGGNGGAAQKQKVGTYNFSTAMCSYLYKQGSERKVYNWGLYDDSSLVDELKRVHQVKTFLEGKTPEEGQAVETFIFRPVTSWWDAPRVWLASLLVFKKPVRVHVCRSTLPWSEIITEMLGLGGLSRLFQGEPIQAEPTQGEPK